jgi:hypothetical protein
MQGESTSTGPGPKLSLSLAWVTGRQILRCVCEGQADIEESARLLKMAADEPTPPGSALLVNLLGVTGNLALNERFELGVVTVKALSNFRRVAIVQEARPDDGFGALVARNRGANIAVFRTENDAMNWLS